MAKTNNPIEQITITNGNSNAKVQLRHSKKAKNIAIRINVPFGDIKSLAF